MRKLLKITLTLFFITIIVFGFALPVNMAGNWYQQFLPNINGRQIVDVHFADSLTGYIITTRLASPDTSYILKTTNGGDNWVINHFESFIFKKISFINQNTGYVGGTGLIKTTNGGTSWFGVNLLIASEDMMFINNDTGWYVFSEALTGGVFRTTNGGLNWTQQLNLGGDNPDHIYMYNARIGFIGEYGGNYLRKTTNGGINWFVIESGGFNGFTDMYFIDSLTGWRAVSFMKKTTDGGSSWTTQTLPFGGQIITSNISAFSVLNRDTLWGIGGQIFYGGSNTRGILYRTTNGGANWQFQAPDTAYNIFNYYNIQFTDKNKGWAYTTTRGVHTTNGGDINWLTDIELIINTIPKDFELYQNYPNPFNPATNIKYQISNNTFVNLIIYDVRGKKITDLVSKKQSAGIYQINWNGTENASGVYFYSLIADGTLIDTRKMILVK